MFVFKDKKFTQEQVEQAAAKANLTVDEYLKANPGITIVIDNTEEAIKDRRDFNFEQKLIEENPIELEEVVITPDTTYDKSAYEAIEEERKLENEAAFNIIQSFVDQNREQAGLDPQVVEQYDITKDPNQLKEINIIDEKARVSKSELEQRKKREEEAIAFSGGQARTLAQGGDIEAKELPVGKSIVNSVTNGLLQLQGVDDRFKLVLGTITDNDELIAKANAEIEKLNAFQSPTIGFTDLPEREGALNKVGGGIAAVINAVTAFGASYVTAAATAGVGLASDMVGYAIKDYNDQKAESKGVTLGELYEQGENEILIPAALGTIGYSLEKAGIKGVNNYINALTLGAKKRLYLLLAAGGKEGGTEWTQSGIEKINELLGQGKSLEEAVKGGWDVMRSTEGLESALQGAFGGKAFAVTGRAFRDSTFKGDQTTPPQDDTTPPTEPTQPTPPSEPVSPIEDVTPPDGRKTIKIPNITSVRNVKEVNKIKASANLRTTSESKGILILMLNLSELENSKYRKNLSTEEVAVINSTQEKIRQELANRIQASNKLVNSLSENQINEINTNVDNIDALKSQLLNVQSSDKFTDSDSANITNVINKEISDLNQNIYNIKNEAEIALEGVEVVAQDKSQKPAATLQDVASEINVEAQTVDDMVNKVANRATSKYFQGIPQNIREKAGLDRKTYLESAKAELLLIAQNYDGSRVDADGNQIAFDRYMANTGMQRLNSLAGRLGVESAEGPTTVSVEAEQVQEIADPSTVETVETVTETTPATINVFGQGVEGETLESQTVGAIQESELGRKIQNAETVEINELNTLNEEVSAPILAEELNIPVEVITDTKLNINDQHNPSNIQRFILKNAQTVLGTLKANTNVEVVGSLKNPEVKIRVGGKPLKLPRKLLDLFFDKTDIRVGNNFQYKLKPNLTVKDIQTAVGIKDGKVDPDFINRSGEAQTAKAILTLLSRIRTNSALEGITTGEVAGTILSATPAKAKTATERAVDYLTEQERKFKGVIFSGVPINKVFTVVKGAVKLLDKGIKAGKKLPQIIAEVKKYIQNKLKQFGIKFSNNVANTFIDVYEKTGDYNKAVNAVVNSINSSIPSNLYNINVIDLKVMSPLLKKLGVTKKDDSTVKNYIKENIVPLLKENLTPEQKVLLAYTLQGTGKNKVDDTVGRSGMVYRDLADALKALGISKDEYNNIRKNNPEIKKALQFAGTSIVATSKLKLETLNELKNNKDLQITVQQENDAKLDALDNLITTLVKIVQKNPESADGIIHTLGLQSDYQGHFIRRLIPLVSFTDPSLLEKGAHDEHYSKSLATTRYIQQIIEFASKDVKYNPSNDIDALKKGIARGVVSKKEGANADNKKGTGESRLISQQPVEEVYNIVENPNLHWVLPNTEMNPSSEILSLEIIYTQYKANEVIKNGEEALQTPKVKKELDKIKSVQDQDLSKGFNNILQENKGIKADARYSDIAARREGRDKGRFKFFLPPGAEDFKGLVYTFLGKGKIGEKQFEFFDNNLIKPYQQAIAQIETFRRTLKLDYSTLLKGSPEARALLNKKIPTKGKTDFTYDQAVRAYLMDQSGFNLSEAGLSKRDAKLLVDTIKNDPIMASFAQGLQLITKQDTWLSPNGGFDVQTIQSDLHRLTSGEGRKRFLDNSGFMQNSGEIFSKDNLNKIEATYGKGVREAIEDMMYRMKNGTNRPSGTNRLTNSFNNWVNRSIGAIMFFNRKSALLQTISSVNFINWSDNNPLKAAAAFANQKQYWSDFARIFNSAKLKERRAGLKGDINEAELASAVKGANNKAEAALSWLLKQGFLPTQMADSFAIASGGASFYRNRINTYKKQGLSDVEAEKKAFEDFSRISEESQQSADPSMISEQQASPLGRLILAFQNTPMQYTRLMKRSAQDLVAGRGDAKTHISKIIYYGAVQNFMFAALQSALFTLIPGFDDEEEKTLEEQTAQQRRDETKNVRIVNNMVDTVLRGSGIYGAIGATLKNTIIKFYQNEQKDPFAKDNADILLEAINLSPPIGSKLRKLNNALRTREFEKDVIEERGWEITRDGRLNLSPSYRVLGSTAEAVANIPIERIIAEISALTEMTDSRNSSMERIALGLGWRTWDLGIRNEEHDQIKVEVKERKKEERKKKLQFEREEKKRLEEEKRFEGLSDKEINNLKRRDQIEALTKKQQVDSLVKLGVSKALIRSLRLESDRIDKIIELNTK